MPASATRPRGPAVRAFPASVEETAAFIVAASRVGGSVIRIRIVNRARSSPRQGRYTAEKLRCKRLLQSIALRTSFAVTDPIEEIRGHGEER